jgi:threonine aldolase
LLTELETLKAIAAKIQANFELASSDFKQLPQCDMRIDNTVQKVGILLSADELNDITK